MSLWTKFRDTIVGVAKVGIGTAFGGPIGGLIAGSVGGTRRAPPSRIPGTPPIRPGGGFVLERDPMGRRIGVSQSQNIVGLAGPAAGAVIRAGAAVLRSPAVKAGAAAAAGAILGDLVLDEGGAVVGVRRKRRRMNPCNPKALRRAVRRLSMYHKQNKKIEQQLRKLAPPRRAARRVAHHHHPTH